jgi:hypothetical protein
MERPASAVNETAMSHLLVALHGLAAHALAADPDPAPAASAPEAAPASVTNADLRATLAYADGSTKSMHVTRIERTVDFYGDEGWTTDDGKLKLTVESGGKEKQVAWKDVKSISVVPGKIPDEVDCTYSSDFTPWMYECTLRTTANVTLKDGPVEFSVFKYTVREQDTSSADFGDAEENHGLYAKLQQQVRADAKGALLKSVTVQ